jgi:hypothetical protein
VKQQQEVGLGGGGKLERPSHRSGESLILLQSNDAPWPEQLLEYLGRPIGRRVVDREHAESRMRLPREGRERLPDPGCSVAHDDNGEHAGDVHGVGLA